MVRKIAPYIAILCFGILVGTALRLGPPPMGMPHPGRRPPVTHFAKELGLSKEQVTKIQGLQTANEQTFENYFTEIERLQRDLEESIFKITDSSEVSRRFEELLAAKNEAEKGHFKMVVAVHSILDSNQLELLKQIKNRHEN